MALLKAQCGRAYKLKKFYTSKGEYTDRHGRRYTMRRVWITG